MENEKEMIELLINHEKRLKLLEEAIVEINKLIKKAESIIIPRLQSNISLNIKADKITENASTLANYDVLLITLRELVHNSCNAMVEKGGKITIEFEIVHDNVIISVSDEGPGTARSASFSSVPPSRAYPWPQHSHPGRRLPAPGL